MLHITIFAFSIFPSTIFAQFKLDTKKEISIFAGAGLLYGIPLLCAPKDKVLTQEIVNGLDASTLNFLDKYAAGNYDPNLALTSDIAIASLAGAAVATFSLHPKLRSGWLTYGVMFTETLGTTIGLTNLSKSFIPRYRPHVYSKISTLAQKQEWSPDKSFFSGHTCQSFALATFIAQVYPNSPEKKYVVIGSYSLATSIAILRYKSGAHFPTDLIAGATLGTAAAWLICKMHRMDDSKVSFGLHSFGDSLVFGASLKI